MKALRYSLAAKITAFLLLFPVSGLCLISLALVAYHYSFKEYLPLVNNVSYNTALSLLPVSFVVAVLLFAFILASAGEKEGEEQIVLNGFDRIYSDIYLLFFCGFLAFGFMLLNEFDYLVGDIMLLILITLVLFYLYTVVTLSLITLTKRVRTQTLLSNSLTFHLLRFAREVIVDLGDVYQAALAVILFGLINGYFLLNFHSGLVRFAFMLFNISVFCVVVYIALQISRLKKSVFAISHGDLSTTVDSSQFILGFRDQAVALNEINQGFQKALDERMRSERFKTELITNVSHDIKTPLTSIVNFVDLLKKEDLNNDTACEYLAVLEKKTNRLQELIDDLMEASKASTGNITVNKENININELVKQISGEYDERLSEKGLQVILNLPEQNVTIQADSRHMWRVMENLMSNIKKYATPNTRVYIDLITEDKTMSLSVKNISEEELNISADELMERFVREAAQETLKGAAWACPSQKA